MHVQKVLLLMHRGRGEIPFSLQLLALHKWYADSEDPLVLRGGHLCFPQSTLGEGEELKSPALVFLITHPTQTRLRIVCLVASHSNFSHYTLLRFEWMV